MTEEVARLREGLRTIAQVAGLHYYGGAFDPEHMRSIANYAVGVLNGEPSPGDLDEAPPSVLADEALAEVRGTGDLLGQLSLYVNWRWLTKQVETEHKERWADAVEEWSAALNEGSSEPGQRADRWWRCPTCGPDIRAGEHDGRHEHCRYAAHLPQDVTG